MVVKISKCKIAIKKNQLHQTYFTLTTLYVVAPLTYKLVIFIFNSGPVICIKSMKIGSICGVTYPCPKSPLAKLGFTRSNISCMQAFVFEELEHGCMTLAVFKIKSRWLLIIFYVYTTILINHFYLRKLAKAKLILRMTSVARMKFILCFLQIVLIDWLN